MAACECDCGSKWDGVEKDESVVILSSAARARARARSSCSSCSSSSSSSYGRIRFATIPKMAAIRNGVEITMVILSKQEKKRRKDEHGSSVACEPEQTALNTVRTYQGKS